MAEGGALPKVTTYVQVGHRQPVYIIILYIRKDTSTES